MTNPYLIFAVAIAAGALVIPLIARLLGAFTVEVEDESVALVTHFGRLTRTLRRPGLHVLPARVLPWVSVLPVSLKRDFRHFEGIHLNDARGTTMMVDLWLEFRIVDPQRALFEIADWDRSLRNLVTHAASAILSGREFKDVLHDRVELGELLKHDLTAETARWGLEIESALVSKLSLLPEVSQQIFESVAARLERARSAIEEHGRIEVAELEAETAVKVSGLVADAKGQYPLAIGAALARLAQKPAVAAAYQELYDLTQVRPHRTVAFRGFADGELRAADAAMLTAPPAADSENGQRATGNGQRASSDRSGTLRG
jgi:regulator of protease activity HflC (stomatin/prohibitin superfamily)